MDSLCLSQGSRDNRLEEMSRKLKSSYEEIQKRISSSAVVGSDETGCRVNGHKHWFHVWQTRLLTLIVSYVSRGHKVIEEYFPDGFLHSFYVSDCWASQLKVPAKRHQLCIAHLLRELLNFEKSLNSQWSVSMMNLLYRAWKLKKILTPDDYKTPSAKVLEIERELDELLSVDATEFHAKKQALINRLIKHRNSIFTFLYYPDVPPDNNASERAIRHVKVKTKVSGLFRNGQGKGTERFARIRSIIDTTRKNGQDVFAALECIAKCRRT
jgi:transposase